VGLIDFNKPKKVEIDYGFDGGPTGGYMPQMSDEDAAKWRGKRVNKDKDGDRIEVRKQLDNGTMVVIIVAKDGWTYKNEAPDPTTVTYPNKWYRPNEPEEGYNTPMHTRVTNTPTRGLNVRMSMNGPLMMTWAQYQEMDAVMNEAWEILKTG